jgi:hypothetical protein
MMVVFFLVIDIIMLVIVYAKTNIFEERPNVKYSRTNPLIEHHEWRIKNIPGYHSLRSFWTEVGADLVLQVYAIMLFTAFIDYSNWFLVDRIQEMGSGRYPLPPPEAMFSLLPMYFLLFLLFLMPIRIGYWIEDSLLAFNRKEITGTWISFVVVLLFCFIPITIQYQVHFGELIESMHWFLSGPLVNVATSVLFVGVLMTIKAIVHKDYFMSREPFGESVVPQ